MVRGPVGTGETLGGTAGGPGGTEGNRASAFPVHLATGEPAGLSGLILCPQSQPPAVQSPSPTPTSSPRLYLQTPELHTPEALRWTCCLSPSLQVLSRGPVPRDFSSWVLSLGPAPHSNITPPPA